MNFRPNTLLKVTPSEIEEWSVEQVAKWLQSAGLDHLVSIFKREEIDGEALLLIDSRNLFRIGINLRQCTELFSKINRLLGKTGWENFVPDEILKFEEPEREEVKKEENQNQNQKSNEIEIKKEEEIKKETNKIQIAPENQKSESDERRIRSLNIFKTIQGGEIILEFKDFQKIQEDEILSKDSLTSIYRLLKSNFESKKFSTSFNEDWILTKKCDSTIQASDLSEMSFQIYENLLLSTKNQYLIFRGNSKSGKTTNSRNLTFSLGSIKERPDSGFSVQHIRYAFLILDSFLGFRDQNGKTIFKTGLSSELHFNYVGEPIAFRVNPLGIPQQSLSSECTLNFNIFYQMLSGLSTKDMTDVALVHSDFSKYSFEKHKMNQIPPATEWNSLIVALLFLHFTPQQITTIKKILASILQLSLIEFSKNPNLNPNLPNSIIPSNMTAVDSICQNLDILENDLISVLISESDEKKISHRGMTIKRRSTTKDQRIPSNEKGAVQSRNEFANFLYSQLCFFIIETLNSKIGINLHKSAFSINFIDFPGLDEEEEDSLQLLLNSFANETLDQIYINSQIKEKQKLCKESNISCGNLSFKDNLKILDLFKDETKGILDIICETSWQEYIPIAVALAKINQPEFSLDPSTQKFTIKHSLKPRDYFFKTILEKNKGIQRPDFFNILKKSLKTDIKEVLTVSRGQSLIIESFKQHLQNLTSKIENNSHLNFVLCLSADENFSETSITKDLDYHQILTIKTIKQKGFLYHYSSKNFFQRFSLLTPNTFLFKGQILTGLEALFQLLKAPKNFYYYDENQIFLKTKAIYQFFETSRKKKLEPVIVKIQSIIRGFLIRKKKPQNALNKKKSIKQIEKIWLSKKGKNWISFTKNGLEKGTLKNFENPKIDLPEEILNKLKLAFNVTKGRYLTDYLETKHSDLEVEINQKVLALSIFSGKKTWDFSRRWEGDYLEKDNPISRQKLISYLQTVFIANRDKALLFAAFGNKVNNKGKSQKRGIICTERHIYKTDPKNFKVMKEAIPLDFIKSISISKFPDGFLTIHCKPPYRDLLVDIGIYFAEFIATLSLELSTRRQTNLQVNFLETIHFNNSRTDKKVGIEENYVFQELSKNDKLWKTALPDSSAIFVKGNKSQTIVFIPKEE